MSWNGLTLAHFMGCLAWLIPKPEASLDIMGRGLVHHSTARFGSFQYSKEPQIIWP